MKPWPFNSRRARFLGLTYLQILECLITITRNDFWNPKNVCEICGQKATAGILDNEDTNHNDRDIQIRIRYSCFDHYLQVYQKIQGERKKRDEFSKH